ncbi:hypothetical protein D3C76_1712190 [compost metagenome]
MAGFLLDFVDAVNIEGGVGAEGGDVLLGDDSQLRPGFTGEDFDLQPGLEFVFFCPNGRHFLAAITLQHVEPPNECVSCLYANAG